MDSSGEQFRAFARTSARQSPLYARIAERVADEPDVLGLLAAASAGLNLSFDRFRFEFAGDATLGPPDAAVVIDTKLRSAMPALHRVPTIASRAGLDLDPRSWLIMESRHEAPELPFPDGSLRTAGATELIRVDYDRGRRRVGELAELQPHGRWIDWGG